MPSYCVLCYIINLLDSFTEFFSLFFTDAYSIANGPTEGPEEAYHSVDEERSPGRDDRSTFYRARNSGPPEVAEGMEVAAAPQVVSPPGCQK